MKQFFLVSGLLLAGLLGPKPAGAHPAGLNLPSLTASAPSAAREWNDLFLEAIRRTGAPAPVAARNLYHLSLALYETWAAYQPGAPAGSLKALLRAGPAAESELNASLARAAFGVFEARFANAPSLGALPAKARGLLQERGVNLSRTDADAPGAVGASVAALVLQRFQHDGSRQEEGYAPPPAEFPPLNPPLPVSLPGVGHLFDVNFWQPLALRAIVDPSGSVTPSRIARPLALHWGRLPPFALEPADRANNKPFVYLDPGPAPQWNGTGHDEFVAAQDQLLEHHAWLDATDGVRLDISPRALGENTLGADDGRGRSANPVTRAEYAPQVVARGDYARVLTEFWDEGAHSETTPGQWNVIAHYVSDHPAANHRWFGRGAELSPLEWEIKLGLALNGALYDASLVAYGVKGYYQAGRPITAVRFLAGLGQASDPMRAHYDRLGLHLKAGVVEVITPELTQPGERFAHLVGHEGELAIRSWLGGPAHTRRAQAGLGWILAAEFAPYAREGIVTPPSPGYVADSSVFARAAAEVLTAVTGSRYFPGGLAEFAAERGRYLELEPGPVETVRLQWATYADAADSCGLSRVIAGLQTSFDDLTGRRLGSRVGKKALAKVQRLFGL